MFTVAVFNGNTRHCCELPHGLGLRSMLRQITSMSLIGVFFTQKMYREPGSGLAHWMGAHLHPKPQQNPPL